MPCYHIPGGGIACSRGKQKPTEEDLQKIAEFRRELEEGKYDKHRRKG